MKVFIVGISGAIGGLLAERLRTRDTAVEGLVRRPEQQDKLAALGIRATIGDLASMSSSELAVAFEEADAIVYSAGSNGGPKHVTADIDGEGVVRALDAARMAGVSRFMLVSVLPESWRERELGEELDHYFAVKKEADVAVSRSDLNWIILRPSLLLDDPGKGTVSLGPAELHDEIAREDVADILVELLHEPRISRQILELNMGPTPIREAVLANVRESI